jgi:hypothetical protein
MRSKRKIGEDIVRYLITKLDMFKSGELEKKKYCYSNRKCQQKEKKEKRKDRRSS